MRRASQVVGGAPGQRYSSDSRMFHGSTGRDPATDVERLVGTSHTGVSSVAGPKATNLEPALVPSFWEGNVGPLLARSQASMIEACRSPGRMPAPLCRRKDDSRRVAGVDAPSRP